MCQLRWLRGSMMPEANRLSQERTVDQQAVFKGNCEILRTIFQPRSLSSDIYQQARRGLFAKYNPPFPTCQKKKNIEFDLLKHPL